MDCSMPGFSVPHHLLEFAQVHGSLPWWGEGACITQWSYEPCCVRTPKMDRSQWMETSDQTWSTGGGNGKPLQYTSCENPANCIKIPTRFNSVAQSCSTLCDPMKRSTPGLPVHHQLPESTQTHVHWVGDAIQPSHPLSSPSPPALNLPQHQGLFKWVNSSHQVTKVLEFQLQHQSFQWTPRTGLL